MTRIEQATIDEVGEVSTTKGQNYQLRLKLARRWMSIFGSQDKLDKLKALADATKEVDWVDFEETKDGKYTNITEIQISGEKFGRPSKTGAAKESTAAPRPNLPPPKRNPREDYKKVMQECYDDAHAIFEKTHEHGLIDKVIVAMIQDIGTTARSLFIQRMMR